MKIAHGQQTNTQQNTSTTTKHNTDKTKQTTTQQNEYKTNTKQTQIKHIFI